jgi:hypothetical protein
MPRGGDQKSDWTLRQNRLHFAAGTICVGLFITSLYSGISSFFTHSWVAIIGGILGLYSGGVLHINTYYLLPVYIQMILCALILYIISYLVSYFDKVNKTITGDINRIIARFFEGVLIGHLYYRAVEITVHMGETISMISMYNH